MEQCAPRLRRVGRTAGGPARCRSSQCAPTPSSAPTTRAWAIRAAHRPRLRAHARPGLLHLADLQRIPAAARSPAASISADAMEKSDEETSAGEPHALNDLAALPRARSRACGLRSRPPTWASRNRARARGATRRRSSPSRARKRSRLCAATAQATGRPEEKTSPALAPWSTSSARGWPHPPNRRARTRAERRELHCSVSSRTRRAPSGWYSDAASAGGTPRAPRGGRR